MAEQFAKPRARDNIRRGQEFLVRRKATPLVSRKLVPLPDHLRAVISEDEYRAMTPGQRYRLRRDGQPETARSRWLARRLDRDPNYVQDRWAARRLRAIANLGFEAWLDRQWAWNLKTTFGLTAEQYTEMLAAQGGVCAICHQPETATRRRRAPSGHEIDIVKKLAVDHDHATGRIRGLLCGQCNHLLGAARDSRDTLLSALAYLDGKER